MSMIRTVCVYAASGSDLAQVYVDAARETGRLLGSRGMCLVNGAGRMGLMGVCSDACLAAGGEVTGVIPQFMKDRGWEHDGLTRLIVTDGMAERKKTMAQLSDAVIALPGGCGTLDELTEILTWKQLGIYTGPVVIMNVEGYYDPFVEMLSRAVEQHFMRADHVGMWHVVRSAAEAVDYLCSGEAREEKFSKY